MRLKRWMAGYYRLSHEGQFAGLRLHDDRKWYVEIRDSATGNLIRHGGIWPTMSEAEAEAERLLNPERFAAAPDAHLDDDSILEMPGEDLG